MMTNNDITTDDKVNQLTTLISETPTQKSWWGRFLMGLNEFYHAPYRQTMARAAKDEEDFFMLLLFSESCNRYF